MKEDKSKEPLIDGLKELRKRIAELEALGTDSKRAKEEIRELSAAVAQSIDGIAIGDLEPRLTYVNDAFARMHGYFPQEMIGMKVENLHNEEQIDEYKRGMHQIKTHGSWIGEIDHIRKDGTPFPTYMSVTLLKDEKEKPTGILAVCRDITESKQAEKALRESEERFKEMATLLPTIISEIDMISYLTYVNELHLRPLVIHRRILKEALT